MEELKVYCIYIHVYSANKMLVYQTEAIKEFESPLEPPSLINSARQNISS